MARKLPHAGVGAQRGKKDRSGSAAEQMSPLFAGSRLVRDDTRGEGLAAGASGRRERPCGVVVGPLRPSYSRVSSRPGAETGLTE